MKLTGKIGWVSLNNMSKKLFEFDSNGFHRFKDRFFKVLGTDVVDDGLTLMFNRDREPRFPSTENLIPLGSSYLTRIY